MRLGIIGCGLIGFKRARAARRLGLDIVCVHDTDPARAQALASECGAVAAVGSAALLESGIDAVIVATVHNALASLSIEVLRAGKHLLVEKPAGISLAEVESIAAASERLGLPVKAGYNHRFHPAMQQARGIIDSGALGPLMY